MAKIVKQYKVGRAVLFYAVSDGKTVTDKVPKDTVVKQCESGLITNAKIQWWEGKPIVRLQDKNIPIFKADEKCNVLSNTEVPMRTRTNPAVTKPNKELPENKIQANVQVEKVAQLKKRKPKDDIKYYGYDKDMRVQAKQIQYGNKATIGDMFEYIANDFGLKNIATYKEMFAKKVDLNRSLESLNTVSKHNLQSSIAIYLMNMASIEIKDTYTKYCVASEFSM